MESEPSPTHDPRAGQGPGWLAQALGARRLATAESCTAGRVATELAREDGASGFLLGGLVAYHESTKRTLLHVSSPSIYSEEAATEMAAGVCDLTGADVAVATTGVAGPEPIDGVAPGTVRIAVRIAGRTTTRTYRFDGTAEEVCHQATVRALDDLRTAVRLHATSPSA